MEETFKQMHHNHHDLHPETKTFLRKLFQQGKQKTFNAVFDAKYDILYHYDRNLSDHQVANGPRSFHELKILGTPEQFSFGIMFARNDQLNDFDVTWYHAVESLIDIDTKIYKPPSDERNEAMKTYESSINTLKTSLDQFSDDRTIYRNLTAYLNLIQSFHDLTARQKRRAYNHLFYKIKKCFEELYELVMLCETLFVLKLKEIIIREINKDLTRSELQINTLYLNLWTRS